MNREIPFWLGKDNTVKVYKYLETTLFYSIFNSILFVIIAFVYLETHDIGKPLNYLLFCVILYIVGNIFNSFLLSTYRTNADFKKLRKIQFIQAIYKVLSVIFVFVYGFNGFVFREVSAIFVTLVFSYSSRPFKDIRPKFHKTEFIELIKIGLPIFVGSYLIATIATFPKIHILNYGDVNLLGLYAPLATIIVTISVLPDSLTTYLYPKMVSQYSQSDDNLQFIWKKALWSQLGLLIIGIPLVIVVYLTIPMLIIDYLPKYINSIPIIKMGIPIALFMSYKFGYTTFIVLKEWKFIVIYIFSFGIMQYFLPVILMEKFEVINSIISGQFITAFVMSILSLFLTYKATHKK